MPSLRHELIAWALPRVLGARDLRDVETERARLERRQTTLTPRLPTELVPFFDRRFDVEERTLTGPAGPSPCYVITPRGVSPELTIFHVHGGGYTAPHGPVPRALHPPAGPRAARAGGAADVPPGAEPQLA